MSVAPAMPPPASLPPPLSSGAPPGAPPPAQPFHSALAEEWARTAPAEGQQNDSRGDGGPERPQKGEGHRHLGADDAARPAEGVPSAGAQVQGSPAEARLDSPASRAVPAGEGSARDSGDAHVRAPGNKVSGAARELRAAAHAASEPGHETTERGARDETSRAVASKDAALPAADTGTTKPAAGAEGHTDPGRIDRPALPLPATGKDSHSHDSDRDGAGASAKASQGSTSRQASDAARAMATSSSTDASPVTQLNETDSADRSDPGHDRRPPGRVTAGPLASTGKGAADAQAHPSPSGSELRASSSPRAILGGSTRARAGNAALSASVLRPASASGTAQPLQALASEAHSLQETGAAAEGGPVLDSGVDLQGIVDSIRATIEIASKQGIGQARIALQPAELGQIRIHLTQTSDGLLARVTADTPAAAQALAATRGELHQSLSSLGTSLLGLDIGSFKQPEGRDASASGSARATAATGDAASIEAIEEPDGSSPAPRLPLGGLVDVLA